MRILMFSKQLGTLSIEKVAETVASLGLDGVDLTVRPQGLVLPDGTTTKGHVLPEEVADKLPQALSLIRSFGLDVPLITTAIVDPAEPYAELIIRIAAEGGVSHIKLGYWHYEGFGQLRSQIDEVRMRLGGLEALAARYGVKICIHNHSGGSLSASNAIVSMLLDGFDPKALGAYIDPGHMAVEGGLFGWKQELELVSGYVSLVGVKNFGWYRETDPATGELRWFAKIVPLRDGVAPWPEVATVVKRLGFDGNFSVHSEYTGNSSWRDLDLNELLEQTRRDVVYLRQVWASA